MCRKAPSENMALKAELGLRAAWFMVDAAHCSFFKSTVTPGRDWVTFIRASRRNTRFCMQLQAKFRKLEATCIFPASAPKMPPVAPSLRISCGPKISLMLVPANEYAVRGKDADHEVETRGSYAAAHVLSCALEPIDQTRYPPLSHERGGFQPSTTAGSDARLPRRQPLRLDWHSTHSTRYLAGFRRGQPSS
ncbi:hypothetical protein N657DRAFT_274626 [Parathielavia appendiculata]|uniref:Uncharacterized protein n=1 Tax=Parathielavia appendiculata TaxID=2587402 RepID=A0AAN6Z5U4_9PEZI|nr:hypothetical protein N657DRAFT_274626 [Parathielavia appendiculata]